MLTPIIRPKPMNKRILYCFLLLITIISCQKESIDEIVNQTNDKLWIQDTKLTGENAILLNSYASDNTLSISGINSWITIDTNNVYEGWINFGNYLSNSISKKIPITDDLFAWYTDTVLIFNSTKQIFHDYLPAFRLSRFGSEVSKFGYWSINRKNECLSISKSLHCLVPVTKKDYYPAFYLVKPNYYINSRNEVDVIASTENAFIKKVDWYPSSTSIGNLYTAFDKFFVSMNDGFYGIDTIGNVKMLLDVPISQVLNRSDSLFAISYSGVVYFSNNEGENWSSFCEISPDISRLKWVSLDNSLIAHPYLSGGQLYIINVGNQSMTIDTLASGGLKDKEITSLSVFNSKVYVTTLSGLYYKDLNKLRKK